MAYRIPTDIPKLPAEWRPFPLPERIRVAVIDTRAYPIWAQQAAVALTLIEQPRTVPVNNPAGIMCQGLAFEPQPGSTSGGGGWGRGAWNRAGVQPCGYALLREGLGGRSAPFLAFASLADSMRFVVQQCFEDGGDKYNGEDYATHWFGIGPDNAMYESSRATFEDRLAMVVAAWPGSVMLAAWRDCGASGVGA
jgi:hypothetical protein